MDLTTINLDDYNLVAPNEISIIESKNDETFYDIEVKDDHSFFIKTDNDDIILTHNCDGNKITTLFIGFFQRYCPQLLTDKKIKKLRTPIITINNSKNEIVKMFFKLSEYKEYEKNNEMPRGCSIRYYKGLGTWRKELLQKLIQKYGLEYFIEDIDIDENSAKAVDDWIGDTSDNCESRKEYLREFEVNIELA